MKIYFVEFSKSHVYVLEVKLSTKFYSGSTVMVV